MAVAEKISGAVQPETANGGWLTAIEAAEYLNVKPRSLLLWVRQGKIQAYALSGIRRRVWRFRREDLDTALLSHPCGSLTSANCARYRKEMKDASAETERQCGLQQISGDMEFPLVRS